MRNTKPRKRVWLPSAMLLLSACGATPVAVSLPPPPPAPLSVCRPDPYASTPTSLTLEFEQVMTELYLDLQRSFKEAMTPLQTPVLQPGGQKP